MKRLFLYITILLFPPILFIMIFPEEKRKKYLAASEVCEGRSIYIHDRIYLNKKSIDIAFIGSSHTTNAINDSLIENHINNIDSLRITNLGFCRFGRNLYYLLSKDLLHERNIKSLVIEVREDEDRYSHPVFPVISTPQDLISSYPFFNRDYFSDYYDYIKIKMELIQEYLFGENEFYSIDERKFGFKNSLQTSQFNQFNTKWKDVLVDDTDIDYLDKFYGEYPLKYLEYIDELCASKNVNLIFLYLPSFSNSDYYIPKWRTKYEQLGSLLIPPKEIYKNPNHWKDKNHLNDQGAQVLSEWLASQLPFLDNSTI